MGLQNDANAVGLVWRIQKGHYYYFPLLGSKTPYLFFLYAPNDLDKTILKDTGSLE